MKRTISYKIFTVFAFLALANSASALTTYAPGETIDPSCAPAIGDCYVDFSDNGLTQTTNGIGLGGTLNIDTTIDQASFALNFLQPNGGVHFGPYTASSIGLTSSEGIFVNTVLGPDPMNSAVDVESLFLISNQGTTDSLIALGTKYDLGFMGFYEEKGDVAVQGKNTNIRAVSGLTLNGNDSVEIGGQSVTISTNTSGLIKFLTPSILNSTGSAGQVLTLVDPVTGEVEFQNAGAGSVSAQNGLSKLVTGEVELGGDLLKDTAINQLQYNLVSERDLSSWYGEPGTYTLGFGNSSNLFNNATNGVGNYASLTVDAVPGLETKVFNGIGAGGVLGIAPQIYEVTNDSVTGDHLLSKVISFGDQEMLISASSGASFEDSSTIAIRSSSLGFSFSDAGVDSQYFFPRTVGSPGQVLATDGVSQLSWVTPASVSAWNLSGNSGTTPSSNFIGTTDSATFAIRAQNQQIAYFDSESSPGTSSVYLGNSAGAGVTNTVNAMLIGNGAGSLMSNSGKIVAVGGDAGSFNSNVMEAIYLGTGAGSFQTNAVNVIAIGASSSNGNFSNSIALGKDTTNTAANQFMIGASTSPIDQTRINGSGSTQCTITTGTGIACTSDERMKENIVDLDGLTTLDKLLNVRAVTYTWKNNPNNTTTQIGFLAQDLEAQFPELVATDSDGYKSVYYSQITPILTRAIQEIANVAGLFRDNMIAWMGSVENGINLIVTRVLQAGTVRATDQLCVGTVCVTETEFLQMLNNAQTSPNSGGSGSSSSDGGESTLDSNVGGGVPAGDTPVDTQIGDGGISTDTTEPQDSVVVDNTPAQENAPDTTSVDAPTVSSSE